MRRRREVGFLGLWILATLVAAAPVARAEDDEGEEVGKLEFHGYGEVHYNNPKIDTMSPGAGNELDFHRFVLGWEYPFTERLRFEGEIDHEHAAQELELEEAYLEYDVTSTFSVRGGTVLIPVGPRNEFHEPPLYYSVERPYVERYVIPTTWQENGAGFAGQASQGHVSYRAYVVAGLDATKITALGGLHDVSSKGAESKADDLAGTGRVELRGLARGLTLSASGYFGGADQRTPGLGKVTMTILSGDVLYRWAGFDLRGVYDRVRIGGADRVSAFVGQTVGEIMEGWYAEAAYDLLGRDRAEGGHSLRVFARREEFDTNKEAPTGFTADPAADRNVTTGGLAYYPVEKVALKADLEHWRDGTGATLNRVNLGAAFMF